MDGHIYIQPRITGKTTKIIKKFLKDMDTTIVIVKSYSERDRIKRGLKSAGVTYRFEHIFSANSEIFEKLRCRKVKRILIDDYLFFNNIQQQEIEKVLMFMNPEKVLVYTTSDQKYDFDTIKYMRIIRKNNFPSYIIDREWSNKMDDLWSNLLTDPNFKIHEWREEQRFMLPKEFFDTEILGELYK